MALGILGGSFERRRDLLGRAIGKEAGLEVKGVVVSGNLCRPFLG
jgi:hypothetical protein